MWKLIFKPGTIPGPGIVWSEASTVVVLRMTVVHLQTFKFVIKVSSYGNVAVRNITGKKTPGFFSVSANLKKINKMKKIINIFF